MLTLTIQHLIHLTREQRYALHDGTSQNVVGVSVPVWFMDNTSSEPAKEIFCRYELHNVRKDVPVRQIEDGYEITLPYRPANEIRISDDQWRLLRERYPAKLEAFYKKMLPEVSSENLLDIKDKGCECLMFRERNIENHSNRKLSVVHYIHIGTMESLRENLPGSRL